MLLKLYKTNIQRPKLYISNNPQLICWDAKSVKHSGLLGFDHWVYLFEFISMSACFTLLDVTR